MKKFMNKKTITALIGLIVAIAATLGFELDADLQATIIEIAVGFAGGGAAGYKVAKKAITKKITEQTGRLEVEAELAQDKVKAVTANLQKEFGDNVAMFAKAELDTLSKNIDAMAGFEIKF